MSDFKPNGGGAIWPQRYHPTDIYETILWITLLYCLKCFNYYCELVECCVVELLIEPWALCVFWWLQHLLCRTASERHTQTLCVGTRTQPGPTSGGRDLGESQSDVRGRPVLCWALCVCCCCFCLKIHRAQHTEVFTSICTSQVESQQV